MRPIASTLLVLGAIAPAALAQPDGDVLFDLTDMRLKCVLFGECFPDQSRDSAANPLPPGTPQFILPASGYAYHLEGVVHTSGLAESFIPDGSTLAEMMDILQAGQSRMLTGYTRNPSGGLPNSKNPVYLQTFTGNVSGLDLSITLEASISNQGVGRFEIRDIDIPLGILFGEARLTQGSCLIETWTPSPRAQTEWHFDSSLDQVPNSGPSRLRYLDDGAFGTIRGGIGAEDDLNPNAPTGVTQAQSTFTTTSALGIAGPGGQEDHVYVTSPARNLSNNDPDLYRGIGLALFPRTQPAFPGEYCGQWTLIYDLYIPGESWSGHEWPVALINGTASNNGRASCLIRNPGSGAGTIGFDAEPGDYLASGLLAPDRWMRIALVANFMQSNRTRVFVDGQLLGETNADWFYNSVNPDSPEYGDGEPVSPADWQAWGEFPSPWARSSGNFQGSQGPSPLDSLFSLFADLGDADLGPGGRSEKVYLANLYFADDMLTDSEIGALGGASGAGIVFTGSPCAPDFNGDGLVDTRDVIAFLNAWVARDPRADFNDDGAIDTRDVIAFLNSWAAGC